MVGIPARPCRSLAFVSQRYSVERCMPHLRAATDTVVPSLSTRFTANLLALGSSGLLKYDIVGVSPVFS